jgi:hypothetical protein
MTRAACLPLALGLALAAATAAAAASCSRQPRPTTKGTGDAQVLRPIPSPTAPSPTLPAPVQRNRGAIHGSIVIEGDRHVAGDPILVTLTVENQAADELVFDWGSDNDNAVGPLRYNLVVKDAVGATVCDLGKSPPASFGGLGMKIKVAHGALYHDTYLLNPFCETLTRPGRYTMTIVRVLSDSDAWTDKVKKVMGPCNDELPPDTTVLQPGDADPMGQRDAKCMALLMAVPAVAAEWTLDITPWDPAAIRARGVTVEAEIASASHAGDNSRENALSHYAVWLCERARCGCPEDLRFQSGPHWVTSALSVVPDQLPVCPPKP